MLSPAGGPCPSLPSLPLLLLCPAGPHPMALAAPQALEQRVVGGTGRLSAGRDRSPLTAPVPAGTHTPQGQRPPISELERAGPRMGPGAGMLWGEGGHCRMVSVRDRPSPSSPAGDQWGMHAAATPSSLRRRGGLPSAPARGEVLGRPVLSPPPTLDPAAPAPTRPTSQRAARGARAGDSSASHRPAGPFGRQPGPEGEPATPSQSHPGCSPGRGTGGGGRRGMSSAWPPGLRWL